MNKLAFYPFRIIKIVLTLLLMLTTGMAFAAQESTMFTFDGQDFFRISTTLTTADGTSAVITKLNRNGPSYKALMQIHAPTQEMSSYMVKVTIPTMPRSPMNRVN